MTENTRRERFKKVAGKRVQKILDGLDILSNCANRNNYEYSDEDIRKMFGALKEKVKQIEAKYQSELNKKTGSRFKF